MMISGTTRFPQLKFILSFLALSFFANQDSQAQSNNDLAKSYFIKAEEAYSAGRYETALERIDQTIQYLGSTNAKIEALYVRIALNQQNYTLAKTHLDKFFELASDDHSDYREMLTNAAEVHEKVEDIEKAKAEKQVPAVEEAPASFPGGQNGLIEYLSTKMTYPNEALQAKVEGKVYVSFVISDNGTPESVRVLRGPGYGLNKEAERLILNMPKWTPAFKEGKPTQSRISLPINFKL